MILDDFQVAQKKCSVAKTKSDLSSSEDTLKHRKVRKQKVVNNSDSAGIYLLCYTVFYNFGVCLNLTYLTFPLTYCVTNLKLPGCGLMVNN